MSAYQGRVYETVVYLELGGVPATGVNPGDAILKYKKYGETARTLFTMDTDMWKELDSGFYMISWPEELMDVQGKFTYFLEGVLFDNFLLDEFDIEVVPLVLTVPSEKCIISGNLIDIGGEPGTGQTIRASVMSSPSKSSGGSIIVSDPIDHRPDAMGNFSIALLRGETVIIDIPRAGIRQQIVVPDQPSALLLDLIPPLP